MSSNDDSFKDDLTRIEDLPELNQSEIDADDDFLDLDSMAKDLGIASGYDESSKTGNEEDADDFLSLPSLEDNSGQTEDFDSLPSLPNTDLNETSISEITNENEPSGFGSNDFETNDFESNNLESNDFETNDFETNDFETNDFETNDLETNDFESNDLETNEFQNNEFESNEFISSDNSSELKSSNQIESPFDYEDNTDSNSSTVFQEAEEEEEEEEETELTITPQNEDSEVPSEFESDYTSLPEGTSSNLTSTDELNTSKLTEDHTAQKTKIIHEEPSKWTRPEDFEDVKVFAKNLSFGNFTIEGNPPYSVIIKSLRFYEDVEAIVNILGEFNLIASEDAARTKENLERGQILIPRLSEYAAIILCHKLRVYDAEILMGLTEEISPAKSYESNDRGLTSKASVYNNKKYHHTASNTNNNNEVLTSTLSTLDGYSVEKYLGIITESKNLDVDTLKNLNMEDRIVQELEVSDSEKLNDLRIKRENQIASASPFHHLNKILDKDHHTGHDKRDTAQSQLDSIYSALVEKLKKKASASSANAILGITFSIQAISIEKYLSSGPQYQVMCSGNLARINRV